MEDVISNASAFCKEEKEVCVCSMLKHRHVIAWEFSKYTSQV